MRQEWSKGCFTGSEHMFKVRTAQTTTESTSRYLRELAIRRNCEQFCNCLQVFERLTDTDTCSHHKAHPFLETVWRCYRSYQ